MSIPEKPKKSPKSSDVCVKCFAPVECPVCAEDEYCQKEPASCNSCGTASCIKLHRLPKSAFIYKRLIPANDEIALNACSNLNAPNCKLCSKAKCVAVSR
ncbi:hypothetical protein BDF19DRAFT_428396 [Syncephalis fuscata]|nr:hypothetical protein BDF19DRAFT_428396 [Syncephalis fuscata]